MCMEEKPGRTVGLSVQQSLLKPGIFTPTIGELDGASLKDVHCGLKAWWKKTDDQFLRTNAEITVKLLSLYAL